MITYIIIGITVLISYLCFQNAELMNKLTFNAAKIIQDKEYYRLVSHAFVHGNWEHLLVNMFVLFFFGPNIEYFLGAYFGKVATLYYIILYFGGILASNLWSLQRHKNDYHYNAVGASGAVSAILFAFIFFAPWELLYFFGIIPIPGILFGAGYLFYSYRMQMKTKRVDNVAHDAHFLGAVFGFVFPILLRPSLLNTFINNLTNLPSFF